MGPKLKQNNENQGVLLLLGCEEVRAGTLPRFVEQFTSRLKFQGKGWFSTSFVEQETSPLNQSIYVLVGTAHHRYYIYPIFLVRHFSS